jgi:hypothetical protein
MKILIIVFIQVGVLFSASAQALPVLSKTPKSLFLIKKAKIDNDVGEPVLYPGEKQSKLLTDEKIYNKYRLQILDSQKNDWGNTR